MDTQRHGRTLPDQIRAASPMALAVAAIVVSIALLVISFGGTSQLSFIIGSGWALWERIANAFSVLSMTVAIAVGLAALRRGAAVLASGVFIGLGVVLTLRLAAYLLQLIAGGGSTWWTYLYLALEALRCGLLFVAARRARRDEHAMA